MASQRVVVMGAAGVGILALIGIAAVQGWLPGAPAVNVPGSVASPGQEAGGIAPPDSLSPGETVVAPAEGKASATAGPGPVTPRYSRDETTEKTPVPAGKSLPPERPAPVEPPRSTAPSVARPEPTPYREPATRSALAPQRPRYARPESAEERGNGLDGEPEPRRSEARARFDRAAPFVSCPECGTVTGIAEVRDGNRGTRIEVRVRFEDGTRRALRYPSDPGFEIGDPVRLEGGRLVRD